MRQKAAFMKPIFSLRCAMTNDILHPTTKMPIFGAIYRIQRRCWQLLVITVPLWKVSTALKPHFACVVRNIAPLPSPELCSSRTYFVPAEN
jgi:hypothetical protein